MMLLGAVAVGWQMAQAKFLFRAGGPEQIEAPAKGAPNLALPAAWFLSGLAATAAATWLTMASVDGLTVNRPDGDLTVGLTVLGLGVALPGLVSTVGAARRGEGGPALVKIMAGTALGLLAGLGAAALVRPVYVTESFLRAPTAAVAAGALLLLVIAFARLKPPRAVIALGAVVYLGFLLSFLGVFG
jgi:cation:H+ antiporter